jgi:thioredoxin 1
MITKLNKKNFENFISAGGKNIAEFSGTWCNPCQTMKPIIEEIANENPTLQFGVVDVDESYEIAARYGVKSIPTFLVFQDGELVKATSPQITSKNFLTKALTEA